MSTRYRCLGLVVFAAVLTPAVSAAINLTPSYPDAPEGTPEMGPLRVVQTGASTLVFSASRIRGTGTGIMTVQTYDPSGVPTPRSFRGLPATALTSFLAGSEDYRAVSYGTGVMVLARTWLDGLVAARVDPAGVSLDRSPIELRPDRSPPIAYPSLACNAASCLVVYRSGSADGSISATRIGTDGRRLDDDALALGRPALGPPQVVALSDRFIVAWTNQVPGSPTDVVATRVMADGRVLDAGGRGVSVAGAARSVVRVATDGSRVFMSWYATASGSRLTGWYTQLFDADLSPVSPLTYHADLNAQGAQLDLWWDGSHYVHHGAGSAGRQVVRFDASGARVDATPVALSAVSGDAYVAPARGGFFTTDGAPRRYGQLGAPEGAAWPVVRGYSPPESVAVDSDGTDFLAGWYQLHPTVGGTPAQSLVRLSAAGSVLDAPPIVVPLTAASREGLFLTHEGTRADVFRGFPGTGRYERQRVDLATRAVTPPVTVTGSVGTIVRGGAQRLLLSGGCATRFDLSWANLDPAPVCFATSPRRSAAAFDGSNFTFVYSVVPDIGTAGSYLRRMNRDGDILDTPARSLAPVGVGGSSSIAYGGGTYLVTWGGNPTIQAARIAPDGTAGAPLSLGTSEPGTFPVQRPVNPAVVFDGANFVVVWPGYPDTSLRAARVSPAGVVLDTTPLTVVPGGASQPLVAPTPAMASDGRGTTAIVYTAFDPDLAGEQVRAVFLREGGVVIADAGVPPTDAGAAADVPPDVGAVPVDAPVALDASVPPGDLGGGAVDAGGVADSGAPADSDAPADIGSPVDSGSSTDRGVVADLASTSDVAPAADALGADVVPVADASGTDAGAGGDPPDDGGAICDVGGTPGRSTPRGLIALAALGLALVRRRRSFGA